MLPLKVGECKTPQIRVVPPTESLLDLGQDFLGGYVSANHQYCRFRTVFFTVKKQKIGGLYYCQVIRDTEDWVGKGTTIVDDPVEGVAGNRLRFILHRPEVVENLLFSSSVLSEGNTGWQTIWSSSSNPRRQSSLRS